MFYRGPYQDSLLMNSNFKIFVAARPGLGVPSDELQAQSKAGQQIAGHTSCGACALHGSFQDLAPPIWCRGKRIPEE